MTSTKHNAWLRFKEEILMILSYYYVARYLIQQRSC